MRNAITGAAIAAMLLAAGVALAAGTAEQKCEGGQNDAAGKYAACLAKAEKGFVLNGDNEKYGTALTKCETKLFTTWDKLEAAAATAGKTCPANGDQTMIQNFVDACVQSVAVAVGGGTLGPDPVTCNADLGICNSNLGTCSSDLSSTNADLASCDADLSSRNADLASCDADLSSTNADLASCDADLSSTNADLASCDADLSSTNADLASCQSKPVCGDGVCELAEDPNDGAGCDSCLVDCTPNCVAASYFGYDARLECTADLPGDGYQTVGYGPSLSNTLSVSQCNSICASYGRGSCRKVACVIIFPICF